MNDDVDYQYPPTLWVFIACVGGISTGLGLIWGLEVLSNRLAPPPQPQSQRAAIAMSAAVDRVDPIANPSVAASNRSAPSALF